MAAVKALKQHFGKRQLRGITHSDIRDFRAERLATKTKAGKQRSVAAVNRELEKLRRLLNIAEARMLDLAEPDAQRRSSNQRCGRTEKGTHHHPR